jgi:paraquat-inducible protein B
LTESASDPITKSMQPPVAVVRPIAEQAVVRMRTRLWWLTGLCLLLALLLVITSFRSTGTSINIHFKDGYGLKAGDTLRYRGIDLGQVTRVALDAGMQGVEVAMKLEPGNEAVAVEGSQFWIQRARLSLSNVSGLDTVLGAKYVGVIPGSGSRVNQFIGIETPLAMTDADGLEIRIQFPAGEGLEVGNPVRYRGIKVGEVIDVQLGADLQAVRVSVRLVGSAQQLARQGTQFWIEKPRIDLTEVRGLETLLSGNYVAMEPSLGEAPLAQQFDGLAEPPPLPQREGSLEIELDAPERLGIVRSAPITYRGLEVGRVSNVGLARDGASVKITAVVDTEYAELVRVNSKWWAVGGIDLNAGLSGLTISVESLSAWIRGGIAFATPEADAGKPVVTGHRFMLNREPQSEWREWQPRISVGLTSRSGSGLPFPTPIRVVGSWKSSILGIPRRHSQGCWGLLMDEGQLVVPASFPEATKPDTAITIEVAGQSFAWQPNRESSAVLTQRISLPADLTRDGLPEGWSSQQILTNLPSQYVLQVVNPEIAEPIAIDSTRLESVSDGLKVAPGVGLVDSLNGSPVIEQSSGKLVGLLTKSISGWKISKP